MTINVTVLGTRGIPDVQGGVKLTARIYTRKSIARAARKSA